MEMTMTYMNTASTLRLLIGSAILLGVGTFGCASEQGADSDTNQTASDLSSSAAASSVSLIGDGCEKIVSFDVVATNSKKGLLNATPTVTSTCSGNATFSVEFVNYSSGTVQSTEYGWVAPNATYSRTYSGAALYYSTRYRVTLTTTDETGKVAQVSREIVTNPRSPGT
jgi:hypothetical protein